MTAYELIQELESKGVEIEAIGEMLRCKAPKNMWTPHLKARVKAAKPEILALLKVQSAKPYRGCTIAQSHKPMVKAKVRGQGRFEMTYAPDLCWHCKGNLTCDCALCGSGLPGNWKAGQCGWCKGSGYLTWGNSIQ